MVHIFDIYIHIYAINLHHGKGEITLLRHTKGIQMDHDTASKLHSIIQVHELQSCILLMMFIIKIYSDNKKKKHNWGLYFKNSYNDNKNCTNVLVFLLLSPLWTCFDLNNLLNSDTSLNCVTVFLAYNSTTTVLLVTLTPTEKRTSFLFSLNTSNKTKSDSYVG